MRELEDVRREEYKRQVREREEKERQERAIRREINSVLDKIRAEIIERQSLYKLNEVLINHSGATVDCVFNWVLEIIDKYKDKGLKNER